ncbi:MAG: hypothetical protein GX288_03045 [Clostridiales bacterium]|nr:hypothetical protein [Clostridiales bacterium]
MAESVNLKVFPSGKASALTMLYLDNLDLSKMEPEQVADLYTEVYNRINARFKEIKKKK